MCEIVMQQICVVALMVTQHFYFIRHLTLSNTCERGPGRATKKKLRCKFSLFIQWKITNHALNILTFVSEQIAKTKILQNHVGPNIGRYDMCLDLVNNSKNDISRQKYSRLRCLLRVKGLVICFYLGWSGSILRFRKI